MTQLTSTVNSYSKALKLYWVDHGKFPDYGGSWGTCLGKVSDYPADGALPAGACTHASNGSYTNYANDSFYNDLNGYMKGSLPSGKIRTATDAGGITYRGIYYEHQDNPTGSAYPDWAYLEFITKGKVSCAGTKDSFYNLSANVTYCGYVILADGN